MSNITTAHQPLPTPTPTPTQQPTEQEEEEEEIETATASSNSKRASDKNKKQKKKQRRSSSSSFIGVRKRAWGRYVSEIRLPGEKRRVWLGSFASPQMAALAYDSASLYLKGPSSASAPTLNFPHLLHSLPRPLSSSPSHIQSAAAKAAALHLHLHLQLTPSSSSSSTVDSAGDYWDSLESLFEDDQMKQQQQQQQQQQEATPPPPLEVGVGVGDYYNMNMIDSSYSSTTFGVPEDYYYFTWNQLLTDFDFNHHFLTIP